MSHDRPDESVDTPPSIEQRLLVGVPAMLTVGCLAEVALAVSGKSPEFSLTRWLGDSLDLLASIFAGVFAVLCLVAMLWGLRSVALGLGGAIVRAHRRGRHR